MYTRYIYMFQFLMKNLYERTSASFCTASRHPCYGLCALINNHELAEEAIVLLDGECTCLLARRKKERKGMRESGWSVTSIGAGRDIVVVQQQKVGRMNAETLYIDLICAKLLPSHHCNLLFLTLLACSSTNPAVCRAKLQINRSPACNAAASFLLLYYCTTFLTFSFLFCYIENEGRRQIYRWMYMLTPIIGEEKGQQVRPVYIICTFCFLRHGGCREMLATSTVLL